VFGQIDPKFRFGVQGVAFLGPRALSLVPTSTGRQSSRLEKKLRWRPKRNLRAWGEGGGARSVRNGGPREGQARARTQKRWKGWKGWKGPRGGVEGGE
jgi:hypothetical protein